MLFFHLLLSPSEVPLQDFQLKPLGVIKSVIGPCIRDRSQQFL
jgi:hypothetical protein